MAKARVPRKTAAEKKTTAGADGAPAAGAAPAAGGSRKTPTSRKTARARGGARQEIRCYLCGKKFEVSTKTMSTTCTSCNKAIKVEDIVVKSYMPVNDVQTCGMIKITKRGRIAARNIQSGTGIVSEGSIEGSVETEGDIELGPKSSWKGRSLRSRTLVVEDGATLNGLVKVPWVRAEDED